MPDGNMAIQVSPITEDEMNQVRNILQRAMDGVIGMSQLAADVDMLRQTVESLRLDTDRLRQTNANLDEALAQVRKERDEARSELGQVKGDLGQAVNEAGRLSTNLLHLQDDYNKAVSDLASARTERDDHGIQVLELEEALKQAQAKLDKLAEAHASVFGLPIPSRVEQPHTMVDHDAIKPYTEPLANTPQDPHPIQAVGEDKPTTRNDWAPGYRWDGDSQLYRLEAAFKPDGEDIPF